MFIVVLKDAHTISMNTFDFLNTFDNK